MSLKVDADKLGDAVDALGKIMSALGARKLLARGISNAVVRAKIESDVLTDEQLDEIAMDAFEAGAIALAEIGYPGAAVHICNPSEEP